jgi:PAS domain S-box-containing protein
MTEPLQAAALLAALIRSSDDAIVSMTADGTITTWNPAAERLFGFTPAEALGQSIRIISDAAKGEEQDSVLAQVRAGRAVEHFDTSLRSRDGGTVAVSLTVSPVHNVKGELTGISMIARDITDRRLSEREALRLAAIVSSSEDAIVSKDLNGIIQTWNRAAERMFGYTAEEAIGRSITIIIPRERLEEETTVLTRVRAGLSMEHFETVRVRKDGTPIDISLSVSPIRMPSGEIIGASKIARDITEQKRVARQAERADQLKDEFLATLSHELRTPLNAILGYSRMLRSGALEPARRERAIEIVERNASALSQLVSDVLDVSKIVAGKIRLDVQSVDLPSIVDAAIDSVRPAFDAKGVRLERIVDPHAGPVMGDPERLQQVFWNLLINAVKFTPRGGRTQVRLARVNSWVEFVVSDTGVGIPPEFLPHLFERFTQADGRSTREYSGLGLGLALVKHFAELHGGGVEAASDGTDTGATFRVRLPLQIIHSAHRSSTPAATEPMQRLTGITVLAVDDDADSLLLVRDALEAAGAAVVQATSAADALMLLDGRLPDVIVSDLSMPEMDGYDLIRKVRRRSLDKGGKIPAVALTAYARAEDRTRALVAGFQSHLAKPVDPVELVAAVAAISGQNLHA